MRVNTGRIVVWDDAKETLDKTSIRDALAKHRRANPGTDTDLKSTYKNHPIIGKPSGFHSGHVAKNGQRFGVIPDYEADPSETHVYLRKQ